MAAGVLAALEEEQANISKYRTMYRQRLETLTQIMEDQGMKLAIKPRAGFYTLWETPRHAFGKTISNAAEFNFSMIEQTGLVGVHFADYVRYAVCADIDAVKEGIKNAFQQAQVSYD